MITARLGRPSVEDVTLDDMEELRGFFTSIKEGEDHI